MAVLTWDAEGNRLYETGTSQGVLYKFDTTNNTYGTGVAWNGLTAVTESPSGADETAMYADDIKYLSLRGIEEFGATIEAYTYPEEFAECDGSATLTDGVYAGQQTRVKFGFSFKSVVGNDNAGNDYGYKLHIIYGATASPSERSYATVNDSPEAITFSWEVTTNPVKFTHNGKTLSTSCITIDSTKLAEAKRANLAKLEEFLYGRNADQAQSIEALDPHLPTPEQVISLIENGTAA